MLLNYDYLIISNIIRTRSENLSGCRLVLQLPLANPLKPGVKLRMKMQFYAVNWCVSRCNGRDTMDVIIIFISRRAD